MRSIKAPNARPSHENRRRRQTGARRRGALSRSVAWGLLVALVIPLWILWGPRWKTYPPVTAPENLTLIKRLYTVCNQRDAAGLTKVSTELQTSEANGTLSAAEKRAFDRILDLAAKARWEQAQQAALQFAQDQVRQ